MGYASRHQVLANYYWAVGCEFFNTVVWVTPILPNVIAKCRCRSSFYTVRSTHAYLANLLGDLATLVALLKAIPWSPHVLLFQLLNCIASLFPKKLLKDFCWLELNPTILAFPVPSLIVPSKLFAFLPFVIGDSEVRTPWILALSIGSSKFWRSSTSTTWFLLAAISVLTIAKART